MAEIDILGKVISKDVEDQLDRIILKTKDVVDSITKLNSVSSGAGSAGGGGSRGGGANTTKAELTAAAEAQRQLDAALKKLRVTEQELTKETVKNRTESQALGQIQKLNAIIASKYTSELEKLDAKIRINIANTQKYVVANDTQNKAYLQSIATTKKLIEEKNRLAKASGQVMAAQSSMYGSTYSLTQVMRELPNFAIDARIGFMALSNNLPMLMDDFQRLAKDIDHITGKEKGFKGALKEFGKSLLSMNTIMIVASTLLVLFGDDILEVAEKLWNGGDATKYFSEQLSKMQTDVFGKMAEDATKITQFSLDYYAARKKGDKEIIKSLEEKGNKEFGLHKEQLNMIAENVNNWRTAFSEYIKMAQITYQNEFRLKAGAEAEFNAKRAAVQRDQAEEDLRAYLKTKFKDAPGGMSANDRINMTIDNMKAGKTTGLIKIAGELEDRWAAAQTEVSKFNDELEELKKINVTAVVKNIKPDKPKKSGSSGTTQDGSDMLVDPQAYNEERADVVKRLSKLELQTQQNTTDGVIQAFASREAAATAYYENQVKLIAIDKDIALQESRDKLENDKTQLENTQDQNIKLFSDGKITKVRMLELEGQYNLAVITLKNNQNVKEKELSDKSNQQAIEAKIKLEAELLRIEQEKYSIKVEDIDFQTQNSKNTNELNGKEASNALNKNSIKDTALKAIGVNDKSKGLEQLNLSRQIAQEDFTITLGAIESKLMAVKAGSEEERRLKLEKAKLLQSEEKAIKEHEIAVFAESEKIKGDLQAEAAENTINIMKELTSKFFEWQKEMIDKQLVIDTKRQEEKVAQFEDETKVGKHTQEDLEKFKERSTAYQTSLDEEAAKKKEELDKKAFLMGQAFALGQIWINYAINSSKEGINPVTQAWLLVSAIAGTALVAAQTIPAFAEGGVMGADGKAILGDGNKHELVVDPRGNFFISDNKSGLYDLKGGSQIFPDVNKLDIEKVLGLKKNSTTSNEQKLNELTVLRSIERAIKTQKQGNFYGMPLVRQLNNSERYTSRKRGLIK